MPLVNALAHVITTGLTWLFLTGVAGSLIVVLISFFEDLTQLFSKE